MSLALGSSGTSPLVSVADGFFATGRILPVMSFAGAPQQQPLIEAEV